MYGKTEPHTHAIDRINWRQKDETNQMEQVLRKSFQKYIKTTGERYDAISPKFLKIVLHTDVSDLQLGAVILKEGRLITYHSRQLNLIQHRYTTTEFFKYC